MSDEQLVSNLLGSDRAADFISGYLFQDVDREKMDEMSYDEQSELELKLVKRLKLAMLDALAEVELP